MKNRLNQKKLRDHQTTKLSESGKIEAETELPKAIGTEEKSVPEELFKSEEKPIEGSSTSVPPAAIVEKAAEEAVISQDIEPVAENGKKYSDCADSAGKHEKEVIKAPETIDTDERKGETVEASETNVEKEKQADEAAKPDIENPKPAEDCKDPETFQDAPKEVRVKTQKQSNNILKKMKNSLIKAKKAIVGKSQIFKSSAASTTEPSKE